MSTFVNHPEASVSNLSVEKVPMLRDEKQQPAKVQVQEVATPDEPTPQLLPTRRTVYLSEHREQDRRLPLDQFFHACTQQTPFVRALILTAITAIPFVVFILVAHYALPKRAVGPADAQATIFELAKWLLISWATFMGLLWCGRIFAAISTWCCAQSRSLIKFQRLAEAICLRMVLMLWAAVCYAVIPSVFHHSVTTEAKGVATVTNWVATLQKAFKFLIIAFAIILVQGIVLELASIQYIGVYMGPRSQKAAKELDTIKRLYQLTNPHESTGLGMFAKAMRKLLQPINDNDLYYQISRGQGDTEIWTQYANHLWDCIAQGKSSLTHFDLDRQLRAMNRDPARAHDLFTQLDDSCDGEVTLDEVEKLVQRVGLQLNIRGESQRSINSLLRKLEVLLSIVMLGVIFVLYIEFFQSKYEADLKAFWTGITGLSFAFGGVLLEFVNACVFVFGKHPYDVGDYIESKSKKLVVTKIFLTHTNFEEVTDPEERGVVVQISHAALMSEPIVNWTRTLDPVVEKKKSKAKEDDAKDKASKEAEKQSKDEVRDLILLKTARLRNFEAQ